MKNIDLFYNDLFNNYSIDDLQLLAKHYFGSDKLLTPELIKSIAKFHANIMKASMNGKDSFLADYNYNVRKYFAMDKKDLLEFANENKCNDLSDFILNQSKKVDPGDCKLSRNCPQGYTLTELQDIAKDCGINTAKMSKKDICLAIREKTTDSKSVGYDVLKQGVMLADEYINKKTGKPIINPTGWLISEKYDGVRAVWDGEKFLSRSGNIYNPPKWFKEMMPEIPLDGELSVGRDKFQETVSIVRKIIPIDAEWKKIVYHVFDLPASPETAEKRILEYTNLVEKICSGKDYCPIIAVQQIKLKDEQDLEKQYENILENGGEGIMLRKPNSKYSGKRTRDLLKYKPTFDAEARIIDYEYGSGKYTNLLGALVVQDTKTNKQFKIGSGLTDIIRNNYKKTHPIGTIVTYKYTGLTNSGVPRHPRYYRIRNE